jgi:hypothetical protein
MIKEKHMEPMVPKVANFHSAFLTSTSHFGRVNEMEFMAIYDFKTAASEITKSGGLKGFIADIKDQMQLGQAMMKLKRFHIGLDKIKGVAEVKRLYNKAKGK